MKQQHCFLITIQWPLVCYPTVSCLTMLRTFTPKLLSTPWFCSSNNPPTVVMSHIYLLQDHSYKAAPFDHPLFCVCVDMFVAMPGGGLWWSIPKARPTSGWKTWRRPIACISLNWVMLTLYALWRTASNLAHQVSRSISLVWCLCCYCPVCERDNVPHPHCCSSCYCLLRSLFTTGTNYCCALNVFLLCSLFCSRRIHVKNIFKWGVQWTDCTVRMSNYCKS